MADDETGGDVEMGGAEFDASNGDSADTGMGASASLNYSMSQPNNSYVTASFDLKSDFDEKSLPPTSSPAGSSKMRSAPKKKGTAASKRTSKKTKGPKSRNRVNRMSGKGGGDDSSSNDETDNGPYCLCRGPDDHRWMIGCDVCEDWFHGECVDLGKEIGEKLVERFVCPNCTDGKRHYTKYRKTCSLPNCNNPARLYNNAPKERSVFCSSEHCDAWWASMIATLPTKAATKTALEVLTQEDMLGLLVATADTDGWKLGDKPFGNVEGLWANGLPTRQDVLSEEEQTFLQTSTAERLALGNEIVQYKKMMQLLDWSNSRRLSAIEAGRFTKDSCGYDGRLDTVSVRAQFAAWLDGPEGQVIFKAGRLDAPSPLPSLSTTTSITTTTTTDETTTTTNNTNNNNNNGNNASADPMIRGMCDRKRCKPHAGWYKLLMGVVKVLVKETATAAAAKLAAEAAMRSAAEARYERRQLENNYVEVLSED